MHVRTTPYRTITRENRLFDFLPIDDLDIYISISAYLSVKRTLLIIYLQINKHVDLIVDLF